MLKRLACFVSGEHHYRMRERDGRVFLECQQCGQQSTGVESGSRPVVAAGPSARPTSVVHARPPTLPRKADAAQFLRERLANGPVRQVDVTVAAAAEGIADRTLRRARVRLGVVATKHWFGSGSFWVWRLRPAVPGVGRLETERGGGTQGNRGRRSQRQISQRIDRTPEA